MTPEYKKILFATDLSDVSRIAFDHAISLANRYGAQITVLHVLQKVSRASNTLMTTYLGQDRWQEIVDAQQQDAKSALIGKRKEAQLIKAALTSFCNEAKSDHPECHFMMEDFQIAITEGDVVEEIMAQARTDESDVIVMGYHARSKLESLVVGSTSQKLLHSSHIPVFLVRLNG